MSTQNQTSQSTQRHLMVRQQIEPWGVTCPRIIKAFSEVQREDYLPEDLAYQAYHDKSIDLGFCQMLSPKVLAKMFQALQIEPNDKLLLVGVGSGYSFALAHQLTQNIIGLEIDFEAFDFAKKNLLRTAHPLEGLYNIDGHTGFEDAGPYDKILFTGAFDIYPPKKLFTQLNENARLFFFCQSDDIQHGYLIKRVGHSLKESLVFESQVSLLKNIPLRSSFSF